MDGTGLVTAVGAGTAGITATATAGGVTKSATAVAAGATVTWSIGNINHDVDFLTAGAPADIPVLQNSSDSRTFPTSGSYSYRCSGHPTMKGTVRVHWAPRFSVPPW